MAEKAGKKYVHFKASKGRIIEFKFGCHAIAVIINPRGQWSPSADVTQVFNKLHRYQRRVQIDEDVIVISGWAVYYILKTVWVTSTAWQKQYILITEHRRLLAINVCVWVNSHIHITKFISSRVVVELHIYSTYLWASASVCKSSSDAMTVSSSIYFTPSTKCVK